MYKQIIYLIFKVTRLLPACHSPLPAPRQRIARAVRRVSAVSVPKSARPGSLTARAGRAAWLARVGRSVPRPGLSVLRFGSFHIFFIYKYPILTNVVTRNLNTQI
jgi:hypothetical protein